MHVSVRLRREIVDDDRCGWRGLALRPQYYQEKAEADKRTSKQGGHSDSIVQQDNAQRRPYKGLNEKRRCGRRCVYHAESTKPEPVAYNRRADGHVDNTYP